MPTIKKTKSGFNIQHTTREVWGVDDSDLKREDFTFTADAQGYMIQYKGQNIGGVGILGKFKGQGGAPRGFATRAQAQAAEYATHAKDCIDAIMDGRGQRRFLDVIAKIDGK